MIGDHLKVRRLAMEVRQLASARQITVMDGVSGGMYVCSCIRKALVFLAHYVCFSCVCVSSELTSSCCTCCGIGSFRIWLHVVEGEMNHQSC